MSITRHFKLGLNAGASLPLLIHANQYDHGEEWAFTLYNQDGSRYTPSSGSIIGIKSDKLGISLPGRIEGGDVIITESQQMTAAAGKAVFELLIDGETHGTANFVVLVEPRPGDGAVVSASDYSLFQEAINSIAIAGSGAPAVATLASEMTDEGKVYLYAGSETGYTNGHWYYYNGSAWTDGGKYGGTVDATLTMSGVAADAKKVGDEISDLKSEISQNSGLTNDQKQALMDVIEHIGAWTDGNAQTYIANARTALFPPANLTRITAVYTQGGTVYNTDSLDSLKADLVVTAYYSDNTSSVVSSYTLSGTLTEGTSTITVTYGGKTATFTVEVSEEQWDIEWSYTDGLLENNGFTLLAKTNASETLQSNGLLLADTSSGAGNSGSISFGIANEPVPCSRIVYESTFILQRLATLPSTPVGAGYYILYVNNGKGINIALNSGGLGYYEGKDTATKGWHFADVSIATETEYTVRLEIDDASDTANLYLDGSLITTFGIATTASTQTKIYQHHGGSTLHKSIKIRYEQ